MSHMFYSAQNYPEPNTHEHWWQTSRAGRATASEMNANAYLSPGIKNLLYPIVSKNVPLTPEKQKGTCPHNSRKSQRMVLHLLAIWHCFLMLTLVSKAFCNKKFTSNRTHKQLASSYSIIQWRQGVFGWAYEYKYELIFREEQWLERSSSRIVWFSFAQRQ